MPPYVTRDSLKRHPTVTQSHFKVLKFDDDLNLNFTIANFTNKKNSFLSLKI